MNAYFQLICNQAGTSLRLVPPTDGGERLNVAEVTNYLDSKKIDIMDIKVLYQKISELTEETVVPLNGKTGLPQQEMFSLTLSDDHMQAVARFYPPSSNGQAYTSSGEIINDLKFKKVIYGIDTDAIEAYLKNRNYCEDIVLAVGKPPVHGTDASIEYFFNTDPTVKPTTNEDGSVDFFHLNTINHCKEGDLLAKLTREVPGANGSTVCAEIIKPRTIKKLMLKYGRNIAISEDGTELTSLVNGHVTLTGGKVFVSDVYQVENVGTATGNIESEGSVQVNGNVQAGFSIIAKGNVNVNGVVEGAYIEADGDIVIARGMNGMGKGKLRAGGRVILKFVENATIEAGGYIESGSILHSNVSTKTEVHVDGKKGFIAGGCVRATEKVSCKVLGSPMGADTLVEVGVDPESKQRYVALQKEIAEATKNLKNIQPIVANLSVKLKSGEKLTPDQMKYVQSLLATQKQLMERMPIATEELAALEEVMKNQGQACVQVRDEAYAGTKIAIGDASIVLRDSMKFCRFIKDRGDIKATTY